MEFEKEFNKECIIHLVVIYLSIIILVGLFFFHSKDLVLRGELFILTIIVSISFIGTSLQVIEDNNCRDCKLGFLFTFSYILLIPFLLLSAPLELAVNNLFELEDREDGNISYLKRLIFSVGIFAIFAFCIMTFVILAYNL